MKKDKYIFMHPKYPENDNIGYEEINSKISKYKVWIDKPVRIYCDGVYDLFHYGHARSLKQAKNVFPNVHLVVGVTSDKITKELKGSLIMNEMERYESLRHCKYVDEVIEDCPWVITEEFLQRNNIDYVAHDDAPYKFDNQEDIYKFLKDSNRFIPLMRTKQISTSGVVTKIVRDYDKYIKRNLKRGVSAKELNLSFITHNKIKVSNHVNKKIRDIKNEISIVNKFWENFSNEIIRNFISKFNEIKGKSKDLKIIDRIVEYVKIRID